MSDNDFSNDSMLELYLFESTGLLDQLDDILLQSESDNNLTQENINEIFRIMHTIKGSSAMMAFNLISKVSHQVEDLFSIIRENGVPDDKFSSLFDLVLKVSDFLKDEVKKIQNGDELEVENKGLETEVQTMLDDFSTNAPPKEPIISVGRTLGGTPADTDKAPDTTTATAEKTSSRTASEVTKHINEDANIVTEKKNDVQNGNDTKKIHNNEGVGNNEGSDKSTYFLHVYFNEGSKMENIRAFMLINKLSELGTVNESIPSDLQENADESTNYIIENGFYCSYTTSLTREEIETLSKGTLSVESVSFMKKMPEGASPVELDLNSEEEGNLKETESVQTTSAEKFSETDISNKTSNIDTDANTNNISTEKIENTEPETGHVQEPVEKNSVPETQINDVPEADSVKTKKPTKQNLINVDLTKLDSLMDLVGELVITESMVTENPDLKELKIDNFRKSARQLNKLTDELQDIVMSVRLVPISSVFQRMRRVVRDMSKDLNKEAELVLIGENTEVDKTILDALGDPIMHLVRNAMDHAIESKEEREKANKSPTGHIILSAQNMGGDIIISISDDGRGLDPKKILAKAKEKNLLTKPENEYTDKEIFNLLMVPGFSTREQVTEYSGRGVGMDVVKMNIKAIGGSVIIESVAGLGTNIFLKIPITLAIIQCMEIRVCGDVFSLPISNIKESFKANFGDLITDPNGNEMIMLRGNVYPIIRLHERYCIDDAITDINDAILILVDSGDKMACLMVDELIGKSQVVVKPIPAYLGSFNIKKAGVSGCTILGDGSISLILDVMEILS